MTPLEKVSRLINRLETIHADLAKIQRPSSQEENQSLYYQQKADDLKQIVHRILDEKENQTVLAKAAEEKYIKYFLEWRRDVRLNHQRKTRQMVRRTIL